MTMTAEQLKFRRSLVLGQAAPISAQDAALILVHRGLTIPRTLIEREWYIQRLRETSAVHSQRLTSLNRTMQRASRSLNRHIEKSRAGTNNYFIKNDYDYDAIIRAGYEKQFRFAILRIAIWREEGPYLWRMLKELVKTKNFEGCFSAEEHDALANNDRDKLLTVWNKHLPKVARTESTHENGEDLATNMEYDEYIVELALARLPTDPKPSAELQVALTLVYRGLKGPDNPQENEWRVQRLRDEIRREEIELASFRGDVAQAEKAVLSNPTDDYLLQNLRISVSNLDDALGKPPYLWQLLDQLARLPEYEHCFSLEERATAQARFTQSMPTVNSGVSSEDDDLPF